jgi:hypothetical protein
LQIGSFIVENSSGWESSSGAVYIGSNGFRYNDTTGGFGTTGDFYIGYTGGYSSSANSRIYATSGPSSASPDSSPSTGIRNIWLTSTTGVPTTTNAADGDIFLVWA